MAESDQKSSIDKAFILLEAMAKKNGPMSLKELSDELEAPKSTTHGILAKLIKHNAVLQDSETGKYMLGYHMLELGNSYIRALDVEELATPFMQKAADDTNMSVHLMKLEYPNVVLVSRAEPTDSLCTMILQIGARMPLYSNANGFLFLSKMSESKLNHYLETVEIQKYTPYGITGRAKLMKILEMTRKNGYAEDHNIRNVGLHGIAAPVYNVNGHLIYTVCVVGMCNSKEDHDIPRMTEAAIKCASKISQRLGYVKNEEKKTSVG